jgi:hypothetical protein
VSPHDICKHNSDLENNSAIGGLEVVTSHLRPSELESS